MPNLKPNGQGITKILVGRGGGWEVRCTHHPLNHICLAKSVGRLRVEIRKVQRVLITKGKQWELTLGFICYSHNQNIVLKSGPMQLIKYQILFLNSGSILRSLFTHLPLC